MEFTTTFLKKEEIARETFTFHFEKPASFDFIPGQYVKIALLLEHPDNRGGIRLFSMSSSPTEPEIVITNKKRESAFKQKLISLEPGVQIPMSGPFGVFTLKKEETAPRVFIAGGIGITPFRSMIKYAADTGLSSQITLFTSFHVPEEIVFQNELRDIAKNHQWFTFVETVSHPQGSSTPWSGHTGRIDEEFIRTNVQNISQAIFYICGPPLMVESLTKTVLALGINTSQLRVERFTGY